jgi:cyclic-di-AMP phosphodiesterase PgpH
MKTRRRRFNSPTGAAGDLVVRMLKIPFRGFSTKAQFGIGFACLVAVTTLLLIPRVGAHPELHQRPLQGLLGLVLLVAATYAIAWKFTEHRAANVALGLSNYRAFSLVGSAVVVQTVIMRLGGIFAEGIAIQSTRAPFNDATVLHFAIPYAAAALLVCLLVDTQLALITGLITALFAGLLAPTGIQQAMYAMVSCAAAIYGIGRYRERQSVTLAGLFAGLVNAITALALIAYSENQLTWKAAALAAGCGIAGGLLTTIFTAGGLPINESLFGILTDVKLLELSNADLPALGQLALRAPGTNQHSHAVGQLAEEACRAVGANPLLARIGALYHDIGKVAAPDHFVENQHGDNPHDRLRPSQSARIITTHVTYGLRLAKEIGLPQKVADFITQHHGTRTLHFFLRKAQAEAKPGEVIDENQFRYPGPKPQFKETAIMMLADSCEAAARSLAHPDPQSINAIVIKIFDAVITDGQLDECDLTLRELTTIRASIVSALTAIYHARIDYPGFNPPNSTGPLATDAIESQDTDSRGVTYATVSDIPINEGGEVEDEAVSRNS